MRLSIVTMILLAGCSGPAMDGCHPGETRRCDCLSGTVGTSTCEQIVDVMLVLDGGVRKQVARESTRWSGCRCRCDDYVRCFCDWSDRRCLKTVYSLWEEHEATMGVTYDDAFCNYSLGEYFLAGNVCPAGNDDIIIMK